MSDFYTDVRQWGNSILYRGIKNGRHEIAKVSFSPTLYNKSKNKNSPWKSLYGANLDEVKFDDINEAKKHIKLYKDVEGFEVHGMTDFHYQFISNNYPNDISYDINQMRILFLDIEVVGEDGGFPDIEKADTPIVLIAIHDKASNKTIVFGTKDYNKASDDTFEFKKFKDENTLLREFIMYWQADYPDIVSGWNTDQFDFPYLINRIRRILDEKYTRKLSPFAMIQERKMEIRGKEVQTYDIVGISQVDYLDLYKKFGTYSAKESYALGFIAQEELGETKLEIESDSFLDSYENHYDQFVKYNALDAQLVHKLDDKMKLLDLIISIAYLVKCNIKDVFGPVKTWDVFIYNHLLKKGIAVPPKTKDYGDDGGFEGAWVKEPVPGMYGWTMSFDFASLYPTIIRQWNVSPETLVKTEAFPIPLNADCIVNPSNDVLFNLAHVKEQGYSIAANGSMYRKDKRGILPELMEFLMVERKLSKKEMLKLEQEYQEVKNELSSRGTEV